MAGSASQTTSDGRQDREPGSVQRAQPPIRWPRADARTLAILALWLLGLAVALGLPAWVAPPGATNVSTTAIWSALGITFGGALIMLVASLALARRYRQNVYLLLGMLPALSSVFGGIILAVTMSTGMTGSIVRGGY